jgi:hypothetical protein
MERFGLGRVAEEPLGYFVCAVFGLETEDRANVPLWKRALETIEP